ncbi:hypothetical protein ACFY2T_22500 [Streptomyces sp. NPDC001260]|uniref:hypothetical protein n=1 Tax=Streptomyces sp. NPDC001260 TaxID=3364551 RepID=UPI00367E20F0
MVAYETRARRLIVGRTQWIIWHTSSFLARLAYGRLETDSNFLLSIVVGVLIDQRGLLGGLAHANLHVHDASHPSWTACMLGCMSAYSSDQDLNVTDVTGNGTDVDVATNLLTGTVRLSVLWTDEIHLHPDDAERVAQSLLRAAAHGRQAAEARSPGPEGTTDVFGLRITGRCRRRFWPS